MKVGIVGASGFLGLNLTQYLANQPNYSVQALSRSIPASEQEIKCNWFHFDLIDDQRLIDFLLPLDAVFYLAHEGNPSYSGSWVSEAQVNLSIFLSFVECLKSVNKSRPTPMRVIYASSGGAIYGKGSGPEGWKETDVAAPISSYGVLKLTAENYLRIAAETGICTATCLRIGNPFGNHFAHRKQQGLIDVAISKLKTNEPVVLFTPEGIIRDFISIEDLNQAFEQSLHVHPKFGVYNIGSGTGHSIKEALQVIESVSGKKLVIQHQKPSSQLLLVDRAVLNISKAKSELNWEPKLSFKDGIELSLKKARI